MGKNFKQNIYGWIILILFLIPSCFGIAKAINSFLFFMQESPLYTNITRFDTLDMTIRLPENWKFGTNEEGILIVNEAYSEYILITEVNSVNSMDMAKQLFLLSLKDSYDTELEFKEGSIEGVTNIFYVTYTLYTDNYVSGVIENNGIFTNFVYRTNASNENVSPLTEMLKSIRYSRVVDTSVEKPQETPSDNKTARGGFSN